MHWLAHLKPKISGTENESEQVPEQIYRVFATIKHSTDNTCVVSLWAMALTKMQPHADRA